MLKGLLITTAHIVVESAVYHATCLGLIGSPLSQLTTCPAKAGADFVCRAKHLHHLCHDLPEPNHAKS